MIKNTLDIKRIFENHQNGPIGKHRFFSVLVPFVEKDGRLYLLYEVRAADMASDPGEICFPGGHVEKGESPEECALRETFEETGIPPESVQIIGPGDVLYGYANYTLYTTIGIVKYDAVRNAKPAKAEVDEIFLVELDKLVSAVPESYFEEVTVNIKDGFPFEKIGIDRDYSWRKGCWEIPVYYVENRIIWGLTARITEKVISVLEELE